MRIKDPSLCFITMKAIILLILLQKHAMVSGESMMLRISRVAARSFSGENYPENVIDNDMNTTYYVSKYGYIPEWLKLTLPQGGLQVNQVGIISHW